MGLELRICDRCCGGFEEVEAWKMFDEVYSKVGSTVGSMQKFSLVNK